MSERRGKRYTTEEREGLLLAYRQSGRSAARFCAEAGIATATLTRWLGRERPADAILIEVALEDSASAGSLAILLPNGLAVAADCSMSPAVAAAWIRELARC